VPKSKNINLLESQKFTAPYYGDNTSWGILKKDKVVAFINWLSENNLEKQSFTFEDLVATDLL